MTTAATDLRAIDQRHHLHPYTDHAALAEQGGHIITGAEGVWLTDDSGRRLLDGLAGLWCVNVGYGCRRIADAVSEQMRQLPYYSSFFGSSTEPTIELAGRLAELSPASVGTTIFGNSGSEANESALKIIRAYHHIKGRSEKRKVISRQYAYHGVSLGAASLTGLPACHEAFDLPLDGFLHAPAPWPGPESDEDPAACGARCLAETRALIEAEGPDTVAALFAEPVQGAGGVLIPPDGYLAGLRELAREYDILFVADEVITGFGRLGEWFASELFALEPDLITMAKGITSGYLPLSATMMSDEIGDTLRGAGTFSHGYTYTGHPVAAAAALANLDEIEERGLLAHVRDVVGPKFEEGLRALGEHPAVREARALRAIGALELGPDQGVRAAALIREEGVVVRSLRNAIAVSPPLVIEEDELDVLLGAIRKGLDRLHAETA